MKSGIRNQIVSFSGGKDSTAMLLMMLERGEPIHSVVWFDGGWEFPQMHEHVAEVERRTGIQIMRLKPPHSFEYWMFQRPVIARKGPRKGKVHRIGNGWPSATRRWCTRVKTQDTIVPYASGVHDSLMCVGFADDEQDRTASVNMRRYAGRIRFPLIEWGISEADALAYCRERGYTWGRLYEIFPRVSCFCCPLQSLAELRKLRRHFPDLWARMLDMDARVPGHNGGFHHYSTVHDLENRFADEDRQETFPWCSADEALCAERARA